MDAKWQLGARANGLHEAINGVSRKWTAALGLEDEGPRRVPLQLTQHAQFVASDIVVLCRQRPRQISGPNRSLFAVTRKTAKGFSVHRSVQQPPALALAGVNALNG
jgi:hypothetical protein